MVFVIPAKLSDIKVVCVQATVVVLIVDSLASIGWGLQLLLILYWLGEAASLDSILAGRSCFS